MMKIGVLGLGNIAQKAYLPLYGKMQGEHEFILASRDSAKGEHLQKKYGFAASVNTADELIARGIKACFIHTATATHYSFVKKMLMAGVATYVDKPLSENLAEVKELLALSHEKNVPLFVGFNRCFAPLMAPLKNVAGNFYIVQKNRVNESGPVQYELYDLFLHVVDTAVFLLDGTPQLKDVEIVDDEGQLQRVTCRLKTATQSALLSCNLQAGANLEVAQSEGQMGTYRLENLSALTHFSKRTEQTVPSDWEDTLVTRGFSGAVNAFLETAQLFVDSKPFGEQENILTSHELVAKLLEANQK